ncbi:hypothetical protein MUK72_06170 [Halococcus dombrowskii]|uniref:Uncharacterized protein n=1 Tax=Halococcus dombrowskii TaxID=179637 RepID=A0AAV3SIY2_HALDO|nr:hypothetical protein [Halococcus dombrowskii]UOO96288.1 hypothetical protein MUK72_06170 [Halococcus dombrowskii]
MSDEIDPTVFEELPSTDIAVHYHVHYGMAGSFPLRLADLFFADDGLHIAEYAYITPLFGLGTRKHRRESRGMQAIYDHHGLDEVLLQADSVTWLAYDAIEHVRLHDGGRLGRPKLTVSTDEDSYAYRIHDEDSAELAAEIETCADRHGFRIETVAGVGFSPIENVRRFLP